MNINGKCKVYAKKYNDRMTYSTSVSRKKQDGTYVRQYVSLKFLENKKLHDPAIPDGSEIEIKNGWLSCYESKDGVKDEWVITDYAVTEEAEAKPERQTYAGFTEDDDSCPF
jgi:hypothetical protein